MTKLPDKQIRWICKVVVDEGEYDKLWVSRHYGVSVRRVEQLVKKRKRCRYEREPTFSLVHGDWHRTTEVHPYAIVWLDDASRFVLAGKEFEHATVENTIESFKEAIICAEEYNGQIREVNTDW